MSNTAHDNTINFMYFITNYPHGFIHKIWEGSLADHFQSKFLSLCSKHNRSDLGLLTWFYELDTDHQKRLLMWVNENYNCKRNPSLKL